ncbi:MAG: fibronectin type III domain-containing protein [Fluviicola sp.]
MNRKLLLFTLLWVSFSSFALTEQYTLAYRNDPASSAVIGWSGDNGTVHYGMVDFGTNHSAYPFSHASDRTGGTHGITRHFARLTGLFPNTLYYFVIYDDAGNTSDRFYFRTLSDDRNDPVSFISGGDTRDGFSLFGIYTENCPSGDCLEKRREGNILVSKIRPDFIAFTGDYVMNQITSNTQQEWNTWLNDWQLTITDDGRMFPVAFSRGNHEDIFDVHEMFDIPFDEFYSLNIHGGLIRMYMLNSELNACSDVSQLNWLTNDLQNHSGTQNDPSWKFATYHTPTLAIGKDGDLSQDQMDCWVPLFQQHKVRLVMESDSHSTKWTHPCVVNANGDDFEEAQNPQEGVVYIGEGQWGAPHRDIYYTGQDAKPFVRDAGTFDNFFFIRVDKDETRINCVKFENVNGVFSILDNALGTGLPSNAVLWNPSNGNEVVLTNPIDVTGLTTSETAQVTVYPTVVVEELNIDFVQLIPYATVEIYNSLGKLCFSEKIENTTSSKIIINENCTGVCYLYVKMADGNVYSFPIVVN